MPAFLFRLAASVAALSVAGCASVERKTDRDPAGAPVPVQLVPSLGPKGASDHAYAAAVQKLLAGATRSIDIIQFNFDSSYGFTASLAKSLLTIRKTSPKIRIRVLLEKEGFGAASKNGATQRLFQAAGIEVHLLTGRPDPQGGPSGIVHTKLVNVDSEWILAGSTNWTNTSIERNNEANLLIRSPALARELGAYADALIDSPKSLVRRSLQDGNVTLLEDNSYLDALLSFLARGRAGDRLDCTMYLFSVGNPAQGRSAAIRDALAAAAQRGVAVRLVLEQSGYDAFINQQSSLAAKELKAAGVDVRLDQASKITHSKFCLLNSARDAAFLLGSTNWNYLDLDLNHQVNWLVERAGKTGEALQAFFERLYRSETQAH